MTKGQNFVNGLWFHCVDGFSLAFGLLSKSSVLRCGCAASVLRLADKEFTWAEHMGQKREAAVL